MPTARLILLSPITLALSALILGCASGPKAPTYSADQVMAAEQAGNLEALFDQISADLDAHAANPKAQVQLNASRDQIGQKLAAGVAEAVHQQIAQTPRVLEFVPIDTLEAARLTSAPAERWHPPTYQAIQGEIDAEFDKTNSAIAERKAANEALAGEGIVEQLQNIDEISKLLGPGSAAAASFIAERDSILAGINQEVASAVEQENWDSAREMLEIVQQLNPGDTKAVEQLATVNTKAFERDFWKALENGDPDQAYALLTSIATTDSFEGVKVQLASSTDVMSNYYVTLGAAASKTDQLSEAYRRFMEARNIRQLLGTGTKGLLPEEKPFITKIELEYEKAHKADQMGLAWGYLSVISNMSSSTPAMRRRLRETREEVLQRAIKRLSAAPFEDQEDGVAEYGEAVGSKVVQYLFETIPNDIRIIEREQLSDIMREKELGRSRTAAGQDDTVLAAADYLVQGSILEAKVDTTEKTGKKTMRVITEQEERPNPDYNLWVNMSSKERKKMGQPPKTITVPRKEDVTTEVTVHRKVGLFSASYRVIDAKSAKVVFADSVRAKAQHEDTSTEGVELGDFKVEFKLASLPSDIEILDQLADEIANEIGAELAKVLADPEDAYANNADRLVREGNFEDATTNYAYSIVLAARKNEDITQLEEALRTTAVAAGSH